MLLFYIPCRFLILNGIVVDVLIDGSLSISCCLTGRSLLYLLSLRFHLLYITPFPCIRLSLKQCLLVYSMDHFLSVSTRFPLSISFVSSSLSLPVLFSFIAKLGTIDHKLHNIPFLTDISLLVLSRNQAIAYICTAGIKGFTC